MAVKKTPKSAARTSAKPRAATRKTPAPRGPAASEAKSQAKYEAKSEAKAQVDRALTVAKRTVEETSAAAINGYDELAVLGKSNFDAFVQSNSVVARGFEAIGMEVLACAQRSVEENMAQARALIGARDLQEFVELQNDFAKRRLERVLAETAKFTELSTKVANEAMEPLQKRVDATVDTVLKSQAA
jgi:phasin family protein